MTLTDLLDALDSGARIPASSPLHAVMHETDQEALRITGELNGGYHEPARVRDLLARQPASGRNPRRGGQAMAGACRLHEQPLTGRRPVRSVRSAVPTVAGVCPRSSGDLHGARP